MVQFCRQITTIQNKNDPAIGTFFLLLLFDFAQFSILRIGFRLNLTARSITIHVDVKQNSDSIMRCFASRLNIRARCAASRLDRDQQEFQDSFRIVRFTDSELGARSVKNEPKNLGGSVAFCLLLAENVKQQARDDSLESTGIR